MRSPIRIALIAVAAVVVLAVAGAGIFIASFDPNSLKPRIQEAVKRATGRDLGMNGNIVIKPSLWPTIEVKDVTFANPPDFSRPQTATLQALDLQLGILPLLSGRVEIDRVVLINPDILLETNKSGLHNWQITPEVSPTAPAGIQVPSSPDAAAPSNKRRSAAVSVQSIRIQGGTLAYRDDVTGKAETLAVAGLEATAASPDSPLHLTTEAVYNGVAFTLTGDTGSLTRLQDRSAATPWPVALALKVNGANLSADGSLTHPLEGKGYALSVKGDVPDLSALAPLMPPSVPPPLHDVNFSAKLNDKSGDVPDISSLTLHVGQSDLGSAAPGLTLDRFDVSATSLEQGFKADAAGKLGNIPLTFAATAGPASVSASGTAPQQVPFAMTLQAGGATTTAKATLVSTSAGWGAGGALHGISLSGPDADLSGDLQWTVQPRRSLTATLGSNRIDLDALQSAWAEDRAQMAAEPGQPPAAQPPAAQANGPAKPRQHGDPLFSTQDLGFAHLRDADANLTLTIGVLRAGNADYKTIQTHTVLQNGKLAIDPLTGNLPQGHLAAKLLIDATQSAPPVHLSLQAPGLAAAGLLELLHQPPIANGNLEVLADLSAAGASPHALAATVDGSLGLAMAGGTIDNRLLGSVLGKVMKDLNALDLVGRGGTSPLHCFGARLEAHNGIADVRALALSSSLLTMTGGGSINLRDETLSVILRPQVRIAGANIVLPIQLSGPIERPDASLNKVRAAESNAGSVAGAVIGDATPLGVIGGLLGADKVLAEGNVCPAALAAARGQPIPAQTAGSKAPAILSDPAAELRKLFR